MFVILYSSWKKILIICKICIIVVKNSFDSK